DGWHVAQELFGGTGHARRMPWEQAADWWKRGSWDAGEASNWSPGGSSSVSTRTVFAVAVVAVLAVAAWTLLWSPRACEFSPDQYRQVREGMTQAEVEALLGCRGWYIEMKDADAEHRNPLAGQVLGLWTSAKCGHVHVYFKEG